MNKLPLAKRCQILQMLCEGSSMRSVERVVGVSINTVTKLLIDAGRACSDYQAEHIHGLHLKRVQVDEIWAFCYAKQKNLKMAKAAPDDAGDVWTWTAIDADSKLVITWLVANRGLEATKAFITDMASRIDGRFQLSSDAHNTYLPAVEGLQTDEIDYGQIIKIFGQPVGAPGRYSPAECIGAKKASILGEPDRDHISTSYVERHNLTIRMGMRRFTRLTNGHSKKAENHAHTFSLFAMHYNFARIHKTLRVTPAITAGVSDVVWSMEDIVNMVDRHLDAMKAASSN
jgi:transposase-like protein